MKLKLQKITLENDGIFSIKLDPEVNFPDTLYKYYYLNKNSIDVIKNNTLHFSHSFNMNDLMDGSFLIWDIEEMVADYMKKNNALPEEKIKYLRILIQKFSNEYLKYLGTFCACENYTNDLLWSHYTNERGFCIQLDTKKIKESLKNFTSYFFPINYGELRQINLMNYCLKREENGQTFYDANIPIFYSLTNKEEFWEYEKEWRIVVRNKDFREFTNPQIMINEETKNIERENLKLRNISFSPDIFKRIILSTLFFNNTRFASSEFSNMRVKYNFALTDEKEILKEFLIILKDRFNQNIFQVDKYLHEGKIMRNIAYQILILEVNDEFVEIVRRNV